VQAPSGTPLPEQKGNSRIIDPGNCHGLLSYLPRERTGHSWEQERRLTSTVDSDLREIVGAAAANCKTISGFFGKFSDAGLQLDPLLYVARLIIFREGRERRLFLKGIQAEDNSDLVPEIAELVRLSRDGASAGNLAHFGHLPRGQSSYGSAAFTLVKQPHTRQRRPV
jgi:hypothetical protein